MQISRYPGVISRLAKRRRLFDPQRSLSRYSNLKLVQAYTDFLERNQNTCVIGDGRISHYDSNTLPSNEPTEDRLLATQVGGTGMYMFSVIDGHGGWQCAHAVKHRLHYYMTLNLLDAQELTARNPLNKEDWIQPIPGDRGMDWLNEYVFDIRTAESFLSRYKRRLHLQATEEHDPHLQLMRAFEDLDDDIGTEAVPAAQRITKDALYRLLTATSGACACSAVLSEGRVHVAGLGDCRAILGSVDSAGVVGVSTLTEEHRTFNPVERERLIREHPCEDEDIMFFDERLCGILQPTRAFGDVSFKWSVREKVLLEYVFEEMSHIPNYISPPYLIARPDVRSATLQPEHKFLIIATDGLWDGLSDEQAVRLVLETPENVNSATWLIRNSLSRDNEKRLYKILSVPPGPICRNIRDDISVIVVHFN